MTVQPNASESPLRALLQSDQDTLGVSEPNQQIQVGQKSAAVTADTDPVMYCELSHEIFAQ